MRHLTFDHVNLFVVVVYVNMFMEIGDICISLETLTQKTNGLYFFLIFPFCLLVITLYRYS